MTTARKKVELLAPAGNIEGFYGAIHAGADAVYLAGTKYGARAYADNFSEEEIIQCIKYAHLWKRKVYLTVNTLVKEEELEELPAFLSPLVEASLDGVIIQDFGVFQSIKETFPSLPLHVSTQMTVSGPYGARLMADMGAVRIVPARELTLKEIISLKEKSGIEVECFIHGAMCYCYSGQCLFSSILGDRSGNRGRCAQPCRLPYHVGNQSSFGPECYPLSLKDMCTIESIPQLIEAGIDSFKIEGRMKKPEYTAGVTALYRKYIDQYYSGTYKGPTKEDFVKLQHLYIRSEIQEGYYHRQNGKEMITLDNPAYSGSDEVELETIREKYILSKPKMNIQMKARFHIGEPAILEVKLSSMDHWLACQGQEVQAAQKAPVTKDNVIAQLTKLGETVFFPDAAFNNGQPLLQMDSNMFYPLKALNELRRSAINTLEEEILHG